MSNRGILIVVVLILIAVFGILVMDRSGFGRKDSVGDSVNEVVEEIGDEIDDHTTGTTP